MIVDEVERRYDRLLKYFTNNIMYNAAYISSSNPTLSSPQSSTFRNLFGQSNTYRIEELEIYDDSKGNIVN
jgi:hypothetical protein